MCLLATHPPPLSFAALVSSTDLAADVDRATVAFADGAGGAAQVTWFPLLPRVKLAAHAEEDFKIEEGAAGKAITHVRFTIYPDGGISRLRLWGLLL